MLANLVTVFTTVPCHCLSISLHILEASLLSPGFVGSIPDFSCLSDETLNRGPMTIFKLLTRIYCDDNGDHAVPYNFKSLDLTY